MKQGSEQQNTEYVVSLDSFEGPLDLLHRLIEGRKMQINTIALAKVTADYLRHVRQDCYGIRRGNCSFHPHRLHTHSHKIKVTSADA